MKTQIKPLAFGAFTLAIIGIASVNPPGLGIIPVAYAQPAGNICQTYVSNGVGVYGQVTQYARLLNVDLAGTFSTIDEIYGTVELAKGPFFPGLTVTLPQNPAAWNWRAGGYPGWKTYHNIHPKLGASTEMVDIRFNRNAGIYPGQTAVPKGVHHLYAVGRKQRWDTSNFNLTICGKPAIKAQCFKLAVSQANRLFVGAQIPTTIPANAKIISVSSANITVAAHNGKPAETQSIANPMTTGVARTSKFPVALNSRDVTFFSVPNNWPVIKPIDTWRAMAGQPYLKIGDTIKPGEYVSPVNSWAGAPGAADNPAHGNISGTLDICVQ